MTEACLKHWYVIQVFSGFEETIVDNLKEEIKIHKMEHYFGQIIVPTEEVVEIRRGQRKKSVSKFFPGYILVNMIMNDSSWHLVRRIPRIIGFLGCSTEHPSPLSKNEIKRIMDRLQKIHGKPIQKIKFEPGELVRVNDGPFSDFNGVVEEVDYEKSRVKVSVSIFGRATPVSLYFSQVEKN